MGVRGLTVSKVLDVKTTGLLGGTMLELHREGLSFLLHVKETIMEY